jgi:hypothetical protein
VLPITQGVNPRIRTIFLLPCLLAALCPAAPAQAATSWGSFSAMAALSCGPTGGDPGTTAVDTTVTPPTAWQTASVNVTLQGTGDHMDYKVDCGAIQTVANGASVPMTLEGAHTISHRAVDAGGLATGWIDETVQIDTTAPANTTVDQTGWHTANVNVTVQGTDAGGSGVNHVEWSGDSTGSGASGSIVPVTGDGLHTLTTVVEDNVGKRTSRTDTIQIDTVAPVDATAYPIGWQYSATIIDLYGTDTGGSGVARVEWKIDGGSVNTGSNHSSIPIPEGTHLLSTQIVDTAGNPSGFVDHTIQVDLTGPSDDTTVPAGWVTTPQTITVKGTDPVGAGVGQVKWDLDNGTVTGTGPNNSTVPVIADGDHILKTAVNDGHGWTGWKIQHVKIDSTTPTDVTAVSSGWKTTAQTINVTGSDTTSDIEHVEWQLTGPTTSSGTSTTNGFALPVSGDGTWTLNTRVVDYAGNSTGWKPQTIHIDTTAPNNLTALPPATWRAADYSVVLRGADGGSDLREMRWQLDGGPIQSGPDGTQVHVSGTAQHDLYTWAVDVAGNASGQRHDVVKIDTLAPTDTTVAPPAMVANHSTFPVTGTDAHAGVDHVEWKLDNGDVHQAPSGTLASIDGRGDHVLHTRVVDAAGNPSSWTDFSVTVDVSGDATPPTDTTPDISTGWYKTPSVTVAVSATDAGSGVYKVEWRLDGSSIQTGDNGTQVTITGEGHHDFETRAFDVNDNNSVWKYQGVKIDSVTPVDTTTLPTDWTKDKTFTLSGTDATSGVKNIEYQIDGGAASTVANNGALPAFTTDGSHTIRHRVIDNADQASAWKTDTVKIDTVKPTNTSLAAPTGWKKSISLTLTGTDADSKFDHGEWRLDGGDPQPGPVSVTTDGTYTLETRVVDKAGNASDWTAPQTITVDGTAPTNTTAAPSAAWLKDTFTTTVAGSDAGSSVASVEWTLDGGPTQTTPAVTVSTAGAHVLRSRITDVAGNVSAWRDMSFGIDRAAPGLAVDCGSDAWRASAVGCNIAGDGGESGLNTLTVTRNGGAAQAIASGAGYTVAEDGDWTLTVRATDVAGNAATTTAHVRVDHTAPSAGLDCVADGGSAYACRASGADGLSGLASLTYSVDGGPPQAPAADGSFTVAKGRVVVRATDAAGNGANSRALILSNRVVPVVQVPREVSEAILRSGRGSAISRAVGELSLKSTSRRTSVYLRPLALGKGRFRITMKLRADKKRKTYRKTVKTRKGYTPRISVRMGGAAHVTVDLTIRRKSHKRWKAYASAGAELG